jgi:hypothetical protein
MLDLHQCAAATTVFPSINFGKDGVKGWVEAAAKLDKIKHAAEALKKSSGQGGIKVARIYPPIPAAWRGS